MLAREKSRRILAEVAQTLSDSLAYSGDFIKSPNFGLKYGADERKNYPVLSSRNWGQGYADSSSVWARQN